MSNFLHVITASPTLVKEAVFLGHAYLKYSSCGSVREMYVPMYIFCTNRKTWDFLGGLVVKTLCSQCSEPKFDLWSGN